MHGSGATAAAADMERSPETYVGYRRTENFASREAIKHDEPALYSVPRMLKTDHWAFSGTWQDGKESALQKSAGSAISYRFRGRDLHLVLGSHSGKPVRFRITLDGKAPGKDHGVDTDAQGNGVIQEQRLYQLVRQSGNLRERTFRIEFLDDGAEAFAFTFG